MSGTYRHLAPGRYQLHVESGDGPAGIRRPDGRDVVVGVNGGERSFVLEQDERVYYWWRGPTPRPGVRLITDTRGGPISSRDRSLVTSGLTAVTRSPATGRR